MIFLNQTILFRVSISIMLILGQELAYSLLPSVYYVFLFFFCNECIMEVNKHNLVVLTDSEKLKPIDLT